MIMLVSTVHVVNDYAGVHVVNDYAGVQYVKIRESVLGCSCGAR